MPRALRIFALSVPPMPLDPLHAVSPVDGRYRSQCEALAPFFSEGALIRYRIRIEIEYFLALAALPLPPLAGLGRKAAQALHALPRNLGEVDLRTVKKIEKTTNHDVKAVEYFLQKKFEALGLRELAGFIHFGLTSQDVNNTAGPLALKEALAAVYFPLLGRLEKKLTALAGDWKNLPMLARTHGQPASPTRLGKEIAVFRDRLRAMRALLEQVPHTAKFGGATGNFNAHAAAYPAVDWPAFADAFVEGLGLRRTRLTTQVEPYDHLAALFDALRRINIVCLDLCRDVWLYIAFGYFKQAIRPGETGSSTMPHKVNPIDFENAEGNIGLANALFVHLAEKLPVSRLQRDLSDSTVLRNAGVPLAHTVIAFHSLLKGLDKISVNRQALATDLEANWAVVAEGLQTILRREGLTDAYESLKKLTRKNTATGPKALQAFIDKLPVRASVKKELRALTPSNYLGVYTP
jgi:adenylosuccinate lyase